MPLFINIFHTIFVFSFASKFTNEFYSLSISNLQIYYTLYQAQLEVWKRISPFVCIRLSLLFLLNLTMTKFGSTIGANVKCSIKLFGFKLEYVPFTLNLNKTETEKISSVR